MENENDNQTADSPRLDDSSCSAAELLRAEAERLGGLRTDKPIESDLRWAYSVAAAFLDCKSDPAMIHRWQEIPKHNAPEHPASESK